MTYNMNFVWNIPLKKTSSHSRKHQMVEDFLIVSCTNFPLKQLIYVNFNTEFVWLLLSAIFFPIMTFYWIKELIRPGFSALWLPSLSLRWTKKVVELCVVYCEILCFFCQLPIYTFFCNFFLFIEVTAQSSLICFYFSKICCSAYYIIRWIHHPPLMTTSQVYAVTRTAWPGISQLMCLRLEAAVLGNEIAFLCSRARTMNLILRKDSQNLFQTWLCEPDFQLG